MRRRALLGAGGTFLLGGCMRLEESTSRDPTESDPQTNSSQAAGPEDDETDEPETDETDEPEGDGDDGEAPTITGTWPQFGNDAANTGSTSATGVTEKDVRWTARIDVGGEVGGPIVVDGKVIVNETTALDAGTGDVLWESSFTGFRPTPAYADGLVFTGNDSTLAAIDADSGDVVWQEPYDTNGITIYDDRLYVRGSRQLAAFDVTGTEQWRVQTPNEYRGRHEPACGDGIVCVSVYHTDGTTGGGKLLAYDLESGTQQWEYDVGATWKFAPLIAESRVFFGGRSGTIRALDVTDGTLVWEDDPGSGWIETSPAFADGVVYVGNTDGEILGYDPSTGDRVYEASNQGIQRYKGGVAVADGTVYGVSDNGTLTANDSDSGELLWSHEMAQVSPQQQWPAPVDGHVFISDGMGTVYAIGNAT